MARHKATVSVEQPGEGRLHPIKAVWQVFTTVALVAVLALVVAVYLVPRALGGDTLIVDSGSMRPMIQPGDLVAVRDIEPADVRIGDIITFSTNSELVTHRVIGFGATGAERNIITQGDSNNTPDEPLVEAQLRGKVMYHIPKVGLATNWVRNHLYLVFGSLAAAWVVSFAAEKLGERRNHNARHRVGTVGVVAG